MKALKKIAYFLFGSRKDRTKQQAYEIQHIGNELEDIKLKKVKLTQYLKRMEERATLYHAYLSLDKNIKNEIQAYAEKAKQIEENKQKLKGRLISNNAALNRLSEYEDELPELIKEMQQAEKHKKQIETHLFYLKEEKEQLEEERESLLFGYRFLKGMSFAIIVLAMICLFICFLMLQILRQNIWFIMTLIVSIMIVMISIIVLMKDKYEKGIRDNAILQKKAASYINKLKIKLVNEIKYLQFEYTKLGVDSVSKLELYYSNYIKSKDNEKLYLKMNQALQDIEEDILDILHKNNIQVKEADTLLECLLKPEYLKEIKKYEEEKFKIEQQLNAIKAYEEELIKESKIVSNET